MNTHHVKAQTQVQTPGILLTLCRRYQKLMLVLLFLALLLAIVQWSGLRQSFSLDVLRQHLSENRWRGMGLFVLLFVLGNLVQVPGWIFLAAAVLVLGKVAGGAATYLAASLSCASTFLVVRWVGGDAVRQLNNTLAKRLMAQLDAHPIRNVVILRTLFQTLAPLNYVLALSGVGFRKYMVATLLGLPLPIAVYCIFFDYLEHLLHLA